MKLVTDLTLNSLSQGYLKMCIESCGEFGTILASNMKNRTVGMRFNHVAMNQIQGTCQILSEW